MLYKKVSSKRDKNPIMFTISKLWLNFSKNWAKFGKWLRYPLQQVSQSLVQQDPNECQFVYQLFRLLVPGFPWMVDPLTKNCLHLDELNMFILKKLHLCGMPVSQTDLKWILVRISTQFRAPRFRLLIQTNPSLCFGPEAVRLGFEPTRSSQRSLCDIFWAN